MNKIINKLLCVLLVFVFSFCTISLTSCDKTPDEEPCTHRDANDDSLCDYCNISFTDQKDKPDTPVFNDTISLEELYQMIDDVIPDEITDGVRTLTANVVLEMGYATGLHREALIATAVVLFVFILIINMSFSLLKGRDEV